MGATQVEIFQALPNQWQAYEDASHEGGHTPERKNWRIVGPMHIARTREQALKDIEYGFGAFIDYVSASTGQTPAPGSTSPRHGAELMNEEGTAVVGTPDDAAALIDRLAKQSGGFETFLFLGVEWADREATLHSYELFADEVMPLFQGAAQPLRASWDWTADHQSLFKELRSPSATPAQGA
jgi:alkanesulfonate monooxygenase SsuD/methylene tetrahydromethanopterin reductase-like flavin-dependent oxidoreductase (luciferase family)